MDTAKKKLFYQKIMRLPAVCLSILTICVAVFTAELCRGSQIYSLAQL